MMNSNETEYIAQKGTPAKKDVVTRNYSLHHKCPCRFTFLEPVILDIVQHGNRVLKNEEAVKFFGILKPAPPALNEIAVPLQQQASFDPVNLKLGSGTLVHKLGEGGNSRVYKIWNSDLEINRAVKLCAISDLVPDALKRFETEAKIAAQLHHPNIIEVYSIGRWSDRPYLEMEFIDGESVDKCINRTGPFPEKVAQLIMWYLCEALHYAHTHDFRLGGKNYNGIIHRDIKPANVMISRKGVVKLLDFGIARPCDTSLYNTCESDKVLGTLQYLSPEQMLGAEIDARSDLYSLGMLFFEMLTGKQTFPQHDIASIVNAKLENKFNSLDMYSDLDISCQTVEIVNKCLQYKKEDRFYSASKVLQELEKNIDETMRKNSTHILKEFVFPICCT